jgi:AAA domain
MNPHSPLLDNIPTELRTPAKWLQYYLRKDSKHPDKKPRKCPVMKWGTPEERIANLRSLDYLLKEREPQVGVQRYIEKEEGFIYVDLDHVRNVDTREVEPWALKLIEDLDSYTEISASGMGFHIVCRGTLPEDFKVAGNPLEIYAGNTGKLLAMTGNLYNDILYRSIEDRQEQLSQLLKNSKSGPASPTVEVKNWREVFHTVNELDTTPTRVFIKGILEEGITFIGAHSGAGKTWLGLSISHALTTGEPLFGFYPVIETANVIYLVPEMGSGRFRARAVKMRIPRDGDFFCHTVRDGVIDLDAPVLLAAIGETKAIVVLDTAIRFQSGDEQSSTQQSQGLGKKMFDLIRAGAPAVICMHHRSKDLKDSAPTLQNTLRGDWRLRSDG